MINDSPLPVTTGAAQVTVFTGNSTTAGGSWQVWKKPAGKSMLHILLLGKGGNGGTGAIGAAAAAAGGGGGGSGGQTSILIPLALIPNTLFLSLAGQSATTTLASYVSVAPNTTANNVLVIANGGGNGGNASGATGGAVGAAGAIATAATMPLGWAFAKTVLAGKAGALGSATGNGGIQTAPVTGLIVCGGSGGGGLQSGVNVGRNGGAFTGAGVIPSIAAAVGGTATTSPPSLGFSGFKVPGLLYFLPGLGSGSTHSTATGAGLVQARAGDGAYGCGGGGMGGALTGSTAAVASNGGVAFAMFTCW